MPTLTEEAAEAICGALYNSEFVFIQETRDHRPPHGLVTWWTIGTHPHDMRISVARDDPFVRVALEWRIIKAPPRVVKTKIELRVDCSPDRGRQKIEESTTGVVGKCLEVYRDVLQGTGYASAEYLMRETAAKFKTD